MSAVQQAYDDIPDGTAEGAAWSSDQVSRFFDAFQQCGQDWVKVSRHGIISASRAFRISGVVACRSQMQLAIALASARHCTSSTRYT